MSLETSIPSVALSSQTTRARLEELDAKALGKTLLSKGEDAKAETDEKKLKETTQQFESIFIGKLWEQMRKSVPKEGYLHSKQEDQYVGMFDKEFSEHLAKSGGIGLNEMLHRQLKAAQDKASKSTSVDKTGAPIAPPKELKAADLVNVGGEAYAVERSKFNNGPVPTTPTHALASSLYTPLDPVAEQKPLAETAALKPSLTIHPVVASDRMGVGSAHAASGPGVGPPVTQSPKLKKEGFDRYAVDGGAPIGPARPGMKPDKPANPRTEASPPEKGESPAQQLQALKSNGPAALRPTKPFDPAQAADSQSSPAAESEAQSRFAGRTRFEPAGADSVLPVKQAASGPVRVDKSAEVSIGGMAFPELPVKGEVSSDFGWRKDPFGGGREWHAGVDLAAPEGSPVRAAWDGQVVFSGKMSGYGNIVILEHQNGVRSMYGHNKANVVKAGDQIKAGAEIAQVGSTGRATGPHVHFEVRQNGLALDLNRIVDRLVAPEPAPALAQAESANAASKAPDKPMNMRSATYARSTFGKLR